MAEHNPRSTRKNPGTAALSQVHGPADAEGPGAEEVTSAMDKAVNAGLLGVEVDQTPNEHYTVAGVTASKPTPETDPDAARRATG
jgi:hypothetical protein